MLFNPYLFDSKSTKPYALSLRPGGLITHTLGNLKGGYFLSLNFIIDLMFSIISSLV